MKESRKNILVDDRWMGAHGIGRFAHEVIGRLGPHCSIGRDIPLLSLMEPYQLAKKISRSSAQVYFSPGYNPPLRSKIPYVFTVHDLNHLHVADNTNLIKRLYYKTILAPGCRRAYRVLTVSEFSKQQIIEWTGLSENRVVNVGNGVGKEFSQEGEVFSPGYSYYFYIGNRKAHKNIDRLLNAYSRCDTRFDIRLVLTGIKDVEIARRLKDLAIENKVVFTGEISSAELPAYYRGAVALVFPSLYEGFGLPVIEAMACGTPVITSTATSLPEVAGDAAILVNPLDVEELSDAMARVATDSSLRASLKTKGIDNVARFSWEKTASMVKGILHMAYEN